MSIVYNPEEYIVKINIDKWKSIKNKLYSLNMANSYDLQSELNISLKLIQAFNYEKKIEEAFVDFKIRNFFFNDFFPNISQYLLKNRLHLNLDSLNLQTQILIELIHFYNKFFFEDNIKLAEMFKNILDPDKIFYKVYGDEKSSNLVK